MMMMAAVVVVVVVTAMAFPSTTPRQDGWDDLLWWFRGF